MAVCRMLARHTLYPQQLHFDHINKGLRYETINKAFEWENKNGTTKEKTVDKQRAIFNILDSLFKESKLCRSFAKYKALYASSKYSRKNMGHNLFNFLYIVGMAHGASALTTADYKTTLRKEGQNSMVWYLRPKLHTTA